jgi:CheY-like chemotaxis protein
VRRWHRADGPLGDRETPRIVVLVVEDHDDTAEMLIGYLLEQGASATGAADVARANEIMDVLDVDVVVTDYSMPGRSGLDLLRTVRRDPRRASVGCVLISGHERDGVLAARAEELGASFLGKPFELEALRDAVARAARR